MERYTIAVEDSVLDELNRRLAQTRWPDQLEGAAWEYGTELGYLQELCGYWREGYDWRAQETALNQFNHFVTGIDDLTMHFIHERSPHPDALPLIVTHGWPGSIYEFHKILGPLTRPEEYGGAPGDAFHVVCPSIPGYGFSSAPAKPGFTIRRVAEVNAALMAELGYGRYGAQGGDWGSVATAYLGVVDPEHVCALHMNMTLGRRPKDAEASPALTGEEETRLANARRFNKIEAGYQKIQQTKPQTLGYGLTDSPAGLAGWIVEKFRAWSDCDGDVERCFTKDELLTNIMIYWINGNIAASTRLYYETVKAGLFGAPEDYVPTPTGFALFPGELQLLPRSWAEHCFNVTRWTEMPRGGHFAALETPELLVEDLRTFFRAYREA